MWTVVQFALLREGDYRRALDLLAERGFHPHRAPRPRDPRPYPAAVARDLPQDPAVITRAVFAGLAEAGLVPVAVMAAPVDVGRPANSPRALAQA